MTITTQIRSSCYKAEGRAWLYLALWAHTEKLMRNEFWISYRLCGCVQELMERDREGVIYANYHNIDCLITASKNLNK